MCRDYYKNLGMSLFLLLFWAFVCFVDHTIGGREFDGVWIVWNGEILDHFKLA